MRASIDDGTLATDLADYLVKRGLPFRDAHGVVAALVKTALDKGGSLQSLSTRDLQSHSELFGADALALTRHPCLGIGVLLGGQHPIEFCTHDIAQVGDHPLQCGLIQRVRCHRVREIGLHLAQGLIQSFDGFLGLCGGAQRTDDGEDGPHGR